MIERVQNVVQIVVGSKAGRPGFQASGSFYALPHGSALASFPVSRLIMGYTSN